MKRLLVYTFIAATLLPACKKDKTDTDNKSVEIRVLNATPWVFYNCTVDPTGTVSATGASNAHNYGQVNMDSHSAYHTFPQAYRYGWIGLTMNNQQYILQPIDFVGEQLLEPGKYTYKIIYLPATDRIGLELIKE